MLLECCCHSAGLSRWLHHLPHTALRVSKGHWDWIPCFFSSVRRRMMLLLIKMLAQPWISPPHHRPHAAPAASPGALSLIVPDDIFLCSDKWMAAPSQIWQIYVHFLERVDVSCVTGQRSCQSLVLRGRQAVRKVKCFSSHPQEIEVHIFERNSTLRPRFGVS